MSQAGTRLASWCIDVLEQTVIYPTGQFSPLIALLVNGVENSDVQTKEIDVIKRLSRSARVTVQLQPF